MMIGASSAHYAILATSKRRQKIDATIVGEVDAKIRCVSRPDGVSACAALVYDGELAPSVETDGYFDALVPFRKVLGL